MGFFTGTITLLGHSLGTVGGLGLWIYADERGEHLWSNYQVKAAAAGEVLELEHYLPKKPPEGSNFAKIELFDERSWKDPRKSFPLDLETIEGLERDRRFPLNKRIGFRAAQPYSLQQWIPPHEQPADPAAYVRDKLATVEHARTELVAASKRENCWFPVQWNNLLEVSTPHYSLLGKSSRFLLADATASVARQDVDRAAESTITLFRLANHLSADPYSLAQAMRISIRSAGLQALWQGLESRSWNEAQLEKFEAILGPVNTAKELEFSVRSERASLVKMILSLKNMKTPVVAGLRKKGNFSYLAWAPEGIWKENAWALCHLLDLYYFDGQPYEGSMIRRAVGKAADETRFKWSDSPHWPGHIVATAIFPLVDSLAFLSLKSETDLQLARIAIAFERYYLKHKRYPDTQQQLTPLFIAKLPVDPISGHPFKHKLRNERPALWSVWLNETDERGRPKKHPRMGDWCWQYALPRGYDIEDYSSSDEIKLP